MTDEPELLDLLVEACFECKVLVGEGTAGSVHRFLHGTRDPIFLVADHRVMRLHAKRVAAGLEQEGYSVVRLEIPEGEAAKTRDIKSGLEDAMIEAGASRSSAVVAVGGGSCTDLAGFVAAGVLRGLSLVNVPTTLVGAVDAAIGGKTGIDTPAGKNLLGCFHWPRAVLVDPSLLLTLPWSAVSDGIAEMVKYGVVVDPGILDILDRIENGSSGLSHVGLLESEVLGRAVRAKLDVVDSDPFEKGRRRILNFGHTVGHAIEAASGFSISHGKAVAAGMAVESRVAAGVTGFSRHEAARVEKLLERAGLPIVPAVPFEAALPYLLKDKKNLEGTVRMSLPKDLGVMESAGGEWVVPIDLGFLESCWNAD